MSYDRRPWISLKERAPRTHADSPVSAAVDRDCICVGGRDTLRSIYLRCSASFALESDFSRERNAKKKRAAPRRAGRCVTHSREEHIRDPHCERNAIKLRRTDRVIFVELLEREEVKGSRCVCAQRIRASCVAHCISASQT